MSRVIKFPISSFKRVQNSRGPCSVSCILSNRWIKFADTSTPLYEGDAVFLDVMTQDYNGKDRKICSLCVSRSEMLNALNVVKKKTEF